MSNIKFKPIEPGMAIKCENTEEVKQLWMWFWENGCVNSEYTEDSLDNMLSCIDSHFSIGEDGRWATPADDELEKKKCVKFSDLVEPDMSAEEVLRILGEIKRECIREYDDLKGCVPCPLNIGNSGAGCVSCKMEDFIGNEQRIIKICQKWKEQHEKKEPEIETVSICRIIEVLPDDRKRCVHEEDIESDQASYGSERIAVEEILKRYCMEHEGEFRAVHEVISRVKKGKE